MVARIDVTGAKTSTMAIRNGENMAARRTKAARFLRDFQL
jgi:hypothetical protein